MVNNTREQRSWEAGKIDFELRYYTITYKHMLRNNFIP